MNFWGFQLFLDVKLLLIDLGDYNRLLNYWFFMGHLRLRDSLSDSFLIVFAHIWLLIFRLLDLFFDPEVFLLDDVPDSISAETFTLFLYDFLAFAFNIALLDQTQEIFISKSLELTNIHLLAKSCLS